MNRLITYLKAISTLLLLLAAGCRPGDSQEERSALFRLLDPSQTGIRFNNEVTYTEQINPYTFRNFYNGAGAGIGDLDNDGLPEVFLAGKIGRAHV